MKIFNGQNKIYKALICDLVGVVMYRDMKVVGDPMIDEIKNKCAGITDEDRAWKKIKKDYKLKNKDIEKIKERIKREYKISRKMERLLLQIKNKGFKLAILNNGFGSIFDYWKSRYKFEKLFNVLVNSTQVKMAKPEERIFKYVCKFLNVEPSECLFLDDSPTHVRAAKRFGISAEVFNINQKYWGVKTFSIEKILRRYRIL